MEIFSRFFQYIKASKLELKQVNWPTKKETIRFTILVVAVSLGVAGFLGSLDFLFNFLLKKFFF